MVLSNDDFNEFATEWNSITNILKAKYPKQVLNKITFISFEGENGHKNADGYRHSRDLFRNRWNDAISGLKDNKKVMSMPIVIDSNAEMR